MHTSTAQLLPPATAACVCGALQALDLGTWLRSRYVDSLAFLPPAWRPGLAALRTTPIRRTIATLRGVLTGLWPDTKEELQVRRRRRQVPMRARWRLHVRSGLPPTRASG